jgi:secondary thiamine-phosphate synthase enzyme
MGVYQKTISVETPRGIAFVNCTQLLEDVVERARVRTGIAHVYVPATTAGLIVNEDESGVRSDIERMLEAIAPAGHAWSHDATQAEGNAHAHLRACITGQSVSIPIAEGRLAVGTWQSIMLVEFDVRPRMRKLVVTIVGE